MMRGAAGRHRDANEPEVIAALRQAGADPVTQLSHPDLPDLLVGYEGRILLLEVKAPLGPKGGTSRQSLSDGQQAFFELCRGRRLPVFVVRSPEEAVAVLGLS